VFLFDGQLCIYLAEKGTLVHNAPFARIDNARFVHERLGRALGDGSNVRMIGGSDR